VRAFGIAGGLTMDALNREDVGSLLYVISLGIVLVATAGLFFGVGFMWLIDANPPAAPIDPALGAQARAAHAVQPPANSDAARGWSTEPVPGNVAESPTASTLPMPDIPVTGASSNREAPLELTALEPRIMPPAGITHSKRARVIRYHRQATQTHRVALWRSDASAGPNPGGGFYGPPNINVGYVNPR
jgi:hypothetical protein